MSFCYGGVFRRSCVLLCEANITHTVSVCQALFAKIFCFCCVCTKHKLKIMQFAHDVIDKIYYIANFI